MTRWALSVTIACPEKERGAANKAMAELGWGPGNLRRQAKDKSWSCTMPVTEAMLADLKKLAEVCPKLSIKVDPRTKANPVAFSKCKVSAVEKFDSAAWTTAANAGTKAKVDLTSVKAKKAAGEVKEK